MSLEKLSNTFGNHENILRKIFQEKAKIPDSRINPTPSECDYLLILHELVTQAQQAAMYEILHAKFCTSNDEIAIPSNVSLWKDLKNDSMFMAIISTSARKSSVEVVTARMESASLYGVISYGPRGSHRAVKNQDVVRSMANADDLSLE